MQRKSGNYVIKVSLSEDSIKKAIEEIRDYEQDLLAKIDEFTKRMAEKGVEFAKAQIVDLDAIDTGYLKSSITMKKGDVIPNGSCYIIYTDCPYAQYVEFGTGPATKYGTTRRRDKKFFPAKVHPSGEGAYHQTGWYYGDTFTVGMPSRPFMWNTAQYLKLEETIREVAKEVFG